MAAAFDFDKYYSSEKVTTETSIDRSGVELQNPTETVDLATDNVVYYFAEVTVMFPDGTSRILRGASGEDMRIIVMSDSVGREELYYVRPWHRLGELAGTGIDPSWDTLDGRRMETFGALPGTGYSYYLIDDSTDAGGTPIAGFTANVFPRHEAESGLAEPVTSQIVDGSPVNEVNQSPLCDATTMKLLYGALGFYGGRWKGNKWLEKWATKPVSKLGKAVMSYDTFQKRLGTLADVCAENDIGVSVIYYDRTFSLPLPEDREATMEEIVAADITRTGMTKRTTFEEAYGPGGELDKFLTAHPDLVSDVAGDTSTAVIPPVKEAVRAFFYPVDEIESEFEDLFVDTMSSLSKVPVLWRFVGSSKKRKLKAAAQRYQQPDGYIDWTVAPRMAFDLEILLNALDKQDSIDTMAEYHPIPNYCAYPRLIQVGPSGQDDKESHIVGVPYGESNLLSMWRSDSATGDGVYWCYRNDGNNARIKRYERLDADTIDSILIEYFNSAYADKHGMVHATAGELAYVKGTVPRPDNNLPYEAFDGYYRAVARFMNAMRAWGRGAAGEEDPNGINSGTLLYEHFINSDGIPVNSALSGAPDTLNGYYDVLTWGECSIPGKLVTGDWGFTADYYGPDWKDLSSNPDIGIGYAVKTVGIMRDIYDDMKTALTVSSAVIGPVLGALASTLLDDVKDDVDRLDELASQLLWYQRYVKEAPFGNMSMIPDGKEGILSEKLPTWTMPARMMFPVSMYQKARVKYKNFLGRTRRKTVKRSIGVRWAEVTFYDTSVYAEYPQVTEESGEDFQLYGVVTVDGRTITLDTPLPPEATGNTRGNLVVQDGNGLTYRFPVTIESDITLVIDEPPENPGPYQLVRLRVQLAASQPEIGKEQVDIMFRMPALPYDSEIRKKAFVDYGPFSHADYFTPTRYTIPDETEHHDGWKVFRDSSDSIEDLRDGLGIHDKVAMLLSILRKEFGESRVQLVETWRSMDDQTKVCSGGPESYFLSWHNYGLAVKILILQDDGRSPIEKGGPEMKRLIPIARAFEECCRNGGIGTPCNVVWCARLAVGPSLFDWEFLPIGVGHKDAPRFRDATMSQRDPVMEYGYVDVDRAGYVRKVVPDDGNPYVLDSSPRYVNAVVIGGHHYMPPDAIRNYSTPSDIVMYDVKEYVDLVSLKMNANGTSLVPGRSIYDWKMLNPESAAQLVTYYAMVGSIQSARAILAGDYVEKYGTVDNQFYSSDPVAYLQGMLGEHYYDIRIVVPRDGASAYVTLHDGIYHVRSMDAVPDNLPTRLDLHKQQQVDPEHVKWGSWHDGVFYPESEREIPVVDSERPVVDGYEDGVAVSGEALYLHMVVADRVHQRYCEIRDMFESFSGALMYDRTEFGPNANKTDMLENEFGLIEAQDLISFDDLERISGGILADTGDVKVDGSIYEKVVNNAQLAGIRKASLTKEHIHIKDMPSKSDAKTLYDLLQKGRGYMANDIMK